MSTVQGNDRLEVGTPPEQGASDEPSQPATTKRRAASRGEGSGTKRKTKASAKAAPEAAPQESPVAESVAEESATPEGTAPESPAKVDGARPKAVPKAPDPRLLQLYRSEVVPTIMQEFGYRNIMQVPRLKKVVLNIGLGEALTNQKAIESATRDMATISGQKPVVTKAKKSIANFKLREGNPIGVAVTLRGNRMYDFMDRLLNTALPRVRDFRGVSTGSFDGRGNYSMGIREQIIFPEIDYGQIERIRGLQVTITTSARTDAEANRLLALLGMPFARED